MAIVASTCFVTLMALLLPSSNQAFRLLILFVPTLGAFICWAFLQTLPRSDTLPWSASVRVIAPVIILLSVMVFMAVMNEMKLLRWDDDLFPAVVIFSLLMDWRSFIAADRYPRVGILKTLVAVGLLICVSLIFEGPTNDTVFAAVLGAALVVTIQILAPHVQASKKKHSSKAPVVGQAIDLDNHIDGLAETRNQTDSLLLKEEI